MPDITGISHGYRIEFEGKVPGNRLSPKQKYYMRKFRACGAITGVYFSERAAERLLYYQLKARGIILEGKYFKKIKEEVENDRKKRI